MKKKSILLLGLLMLLLISACSQPKPFPATQEGRRAIDDVIAELPDRYPGFIVFTASVYDTSDRQLRIAIRFEEEKTPPSAERQKLIDDLLTDIASKVQKTDWKPLFTNVEIQIVALSRDENNTDKEIRLATKEKNLDRLDF